MKLLEARASNDLGLREVAREAGVTATAVYRHFPSKDALLSAIATRGFAMLGAQQAQVLSKEGGRPGFAQMGAVYVRFAQTYPGVFRLMFSAGPKDDPFAAVAHGQVIPMRLLREQVDGLASTGLPHEARKVIAIRAWALVHGLAMLILDGMIPAEDALIEGVIRAAGPNLFEAPGP